MAAPASDSLVHGKGLASSVFDFESLFDLDFRQRRTAARGAMAVGTAVPRLLEGVMMAGYPGLAEVVHTMGATVDGAGHGRVADGALAYRRSISLSLDGLKVIVHLVAVGAGLVGELGMG